MRIVRSKEEADAEKPFWLFSPFFFQSPAEVKQEEEVTVESYEANPPLLFASNKRPSKRVRSENPANSSSKKIRKNRPKKPEIEKELKVKNGRMMEEECANRGILVDVKTENMEQRRRGRKSTLSIVKMEGYVNVNGESGGSKKSVNIENNEQRSRRRKGAMSTVKMEGDVNGESGGSKKNVKIENNELRSRRRRKSTLNIVKKEGNLNVNGKSGGSKKSGEAKLNRWSKERFAHAWEVVVKLTRENARPRLIRKELRDMVRKQIGDTGLLDHLLKHMVGKVVGDGGERFRRGYNEEGVMFYWLESVDGDDSQNGRGLCRCSDECAAEINRLNEGIATLNRDIEVLRSLKESNNSFWKEKYDRLLDTNIQLEGQMENMKNSFQGLKDKHAELLDKNAKLEAEMEDMSSSYRGLKNEMLLRDDKKSEDRMTKEIEMVEDAKRYRVGDGGDKNNEHKQLHEHSKDFGSSQMKQSHLNLTCQGQAKIKCLHGTHNHEGDLPQLPSSSGSDLLTSLPILG